MEDELEPTQKAPSIPTVTKVSCEVCSRNLTDWTLQDRLIHLNACLDQQEQQEVFHCPTCAKDLTEYNEQRRSVHVNRCIDQLEPIVPLQDTQDTKVIQCPCKICGIELQDMSLAARIRHTKQCGQRHGITPQDLDTHTEEKSSEQAESTSVDAKTPSNAFSVMMQTSSSKQTSIVQHPPGSDAFKVMMKSSKTQAIQFNSSNSMQPAYRKRKFPSSYRSNDDNNKRTPRACPAFKVIQGTSPPFVVDGFQYASPGLSSIYFLSHFHADHYGGLYPSFDAGIIYCNQVTANLVIQELGVKEKYVHPVPMNTPTTIASVQVTFVDANHCPGAMLILFQLPNGKSILHTGDFRYHPSMLTYSCLQPFAKKEKQLDTVYLDTTYANPKYTFPTQEASIRHTVSLIDQHLEHHPIHKILFLFGSYTIGKERLFMEVAKKYNQKVSVSKRKLKILQACQWSPQDLQYLTTETMTNFQVVPMQDLAMDKLMAMMTEKRLVYRQIVAFRPTGWTFNNNGGMSTCRSDATGNIKVYGIPYSEHSSFSELCDFLKAFKPTRIIPTVNCSSDRQVTKQVELLRQASYHTLPHFFH